VKARRHWLSSYRDNDLPHFLAQLFLASEWGIVHDSSFDGPIWSISIEVLAYFVFFMMLLATRSWLLNVAFIVACPRGLAERQLLSHLSLLRGAGAKSRSRLLSAPQDRRSANRPGRHEIRMALAAERALLRATFPGLTITPWPAGLNPVRR